ncbi:MAG: hypothetical protein IJ723_02755, partial [Ruminococcus sp.]|nr:hypothetical protein [Ruminococcus sp.]
MKKAASVTAAIILAVAMTAAPVQNAGVFSTALTAQAYSGYGTYGKYTYVYDESGVTITGYTEDVEELNIPDEIDG